MHLSNIRDGIKHSSLSYSNTDTIQSIRCVCGCDFCERNATIPDKYSPSGIELRKYKPVCEYLFFNNEIT